MHSVVVTTVTLAVCVVAATSVTPGARGAGALFPLPWLHGTVLVVVMVVATCLAELMAVRLLHDDIVEELTLLDAVVLLNILLLPLPEALVACTGGLLLAYVLRRRAPVKVAFNLATYATATCVTFLIVHTVDQHGGQFGPLFAVAVVAGSAGFVAVNVAHISFLLAAMGEGSPWQIAREDGLLTLFTVVGTVGLASSVIALAVYTPLLLPCAILPAVAVRYAYAASAAKHEERRRSARVLDFSQVMASGPDQVVASAAFLRLVSAEFAADGAVVVLGAGTTVEIKAPDSEPREVTMTTAHLALLGVQTMRMETRAEALLGWPTMLVAPLLADGRHLGAVAVAARFKGRQREQAVATIAPLAGALAAALQNADQLGRLLAETSKLRAVVDLSGDGIAVLDAAGQVQLWSPAMARMTGIDPSSAVGAALDSLLAVADLDGMVARPFERVSAGLSPLNTQTVTDLYLTRADGDRRKMRFRHSAAFEGGKLVRDVVVLHDLTAQERVDRLKDDFIATVSHELRTPLTPIKGYVDILKRRGDALTPEKRRRALDVIADRADHLGRMVEDLLLASSITADGQPRHALDSDDADVVGLARKAVESFPEAHDRVTLVAPSVPAKVSCDPSRVLQVLTNLLSNALKYSASTSMVSVRVETQGGRAYVHVDDQGQGIPHDQIERIFDKFHRVEDPMVMSTSGTGLGLYIARHLARNMGGDLTVRSSVGEGSRFTLALGLAAEQASSDDSAQPIGADAPPSS